MFKVQTEVIAKLMTTLISKDKFKVNLKEFNLKNIHHISN